MCETLPTAKERMVEIVQQEGQVVGLAPLARLVQVHYRYAWDILTRLEQAGSLHVEHKGPGIPMVIKPNGRPHAT